MIIHEFSNEPIYKVTEENSKVDFCYLKKQVKLWLFICIPEEKTYIQAEGFYS